jgi:hypothetical protein
VAILNAKLPPESAKSVLLASPSAAGVYKNGRFRRGYFLDSLAFTIVVILADRGSIRLFYFRLLVVTVKSDLPRL